MAWAHLPAQIVREIADILANIFDSFISDLERVSVALKNYSLEPFIMSSLFTLDQTLPRCKVKLVRLDYQLFFGRFLLLVFQSSTFFNHFKCLPSENIRDRKNGHSPSSTNQRNWSRAITEEKPVRQWHLIPIRIKRVAIVARKLSRLRPIKIIS